MSRAILEIEMPESCRGDIPCPLQPYCVHIKNISITYNYDTRHPDCPLKIIQSCKNAERDFNGKCLGYQKSDIDDEPADMCMECKENSSYEE